MGDRVRLAVLISGRGTNLQAIIDASNDSSGRGEFPAEIAVVISNKSDAFGLERAKAANIPTAFINHKDYDGREAFEDALHAEILKHDIDLVVLAGFMRILTPSFVERWRDRMINIHPSLLPDYKGLDTHARAIADGKSEAGCTVHWVVPEMDSGPHILQRRVAIMADDTPETLAARVLEQEHIALPEAIRKVIDEIQKDKDTV